MALEMGFYVVDDTTIQKLSEAPHLLEDFLEDKPAVPGPNHRNVDMFHFIMNGTEDPVSGIKGIFHDLDAPYAIAIGEEWAAALTSETTRHLLKALRKLDDTTIRKRWSQLIRRRGLVEDENEPGLDEAEKKSTAGRRRSRPLLSPELRKLDAALRASGRPEPGVLMDLGITALRQNV